MGDLEFVVSEGPTKGKCFPFQGPHFFIGSGADCQLRFEPAAVRARHAEVTTDAQGVSWVKDLTGAGLLWLNGEVTAEGQLYPGTFVRLGRLELVVRQTGRAAGPSGTMAAPTPLRQPGLDLARQSGRNPGVAAPGRVVGISQPVPPWSAGPGPSVSASGRNLGIDSTAKRPTPLTSGMIDSTAKRPTPLDSGPIELPRLEMEPAETPQDPRDETLRSGGFFVGAVVNERYRVVARLAAGGMGEVYKVEHIKLGKAFAMKVMLPELSKDTEFVERFEREAISASQIGQQNIIEVSDLGQTADGRFYFVMEFLEGLTLASTVHRQGALPVERALHIGVQVARALGAAHAKGIVHRDLKPENVMLLQRPGQPDLVKVLDFGVAKVATGHGKGGHTAIGMVVGTPQYMSPEQAKALQVDSRSDIYSLGLILYELLTGRPTFSGETPSILMVKHVTEPPPSFHPGPLEEIPPQLEELVFQMLAKEVGDRPQTMPQVVEVLEEVWGQLKGSGSVATPRPGTTGTASGGFRAPSGGFRRATSGGFPRAPSGAGQPSNAAVTSTEELPQLRRSMLPLALVAGALLLVGGGVGAYFAFGREAPAAQPPQVVVQPPPPLPEIKKDEPKPAAPAEKVTLKLISEPAATVYEGGDLLGTTPLELHREVDSVAVVRLVAKGYRDQTEKMKFAANSQITVTLEKEPSRGVVRPKKPGADELKDSPYSQEEDLKDLPDP